MYSHALHGLINESNNSYFFPLLICHSYVTVGNIRRGSAGGGASDNRSGQRQGQGQDLLSFLYLNCLFPKDKDRVAAKAGELLLSIHFMSVNFLHLSLFHPDTLLLILLHTYSPLLHPYSSLLHTLHTPSVLLFFYLLLLTVKSISSLFWLPLPSPTTDTTPQHRCRLLVLPLLFITKVTHILYHTAHLTVPNLTLLFNSYASM